MLRREIKFTMKRLYNFFQMNRIVEKIVGGDVDLPNVQK